MIGEHEISIEKLLKITHSYTDPIRIQVVMGDAWLTCEEAKHMRSFELVHCYRNSGFDEDKKTYERLMKYYKDAPVWNLTVWVDGTYHTPKGRELLMGIEARCHYKDIREGWLSEREDIRREKRKEYRRRRKEEETA